MKSHRLKRALDLFEQAIVLKHDDREAWLKLETGGDEELVTYILRMLTLDDRADQTIRTGSGFQLFDSTREWIGNHFGPYRITELLGEGGMGLVFRAERTDGSYQGSVALKLIKNPLASNEIKRRFELERQVLADLRHPNIATLLDAGSVEGIEYVVLEFIDGTSFYEYQRELSIDDTLSLFREVCSAVEYAHQSLIVHRDIKPGNVLVDSHGIPKLLDFGIAKDLSLTSSETTAWALTPAYASPEQISGQAITVATDIYSLGVLLYEALANSRPHEVDNLAPSEVVSVLLESDPSVPSTNSKRMHKLSQHSREDLDAIVMRAMAKDPKRRYRSVSALIDDLDAFSQNKPVSAHVDGGWYFVSKFVKRNKIVVAATMLAVLSLVAGMVVAFSQAQLASAQLARSEAVSRYLKDILTSPDPTWNQLIRGGVGTTVADTLESAEKQLDNDLLDQPLVRIELYEAMGAAQMWLSNKDASLSTRRKALELRRSTFPNDPIQESIGLMRLAEVHDDYRESEISLPMYFQAIESYKRNRSAPAEFLALLYNDTAVALFNNSEYERALAYQKKAISLSRHADFTEAQSNLASYEVNYGRALLETGRVVEAIEQLHGARQRFNDDPSVPLVYLHRLNHSEGMAAFVTQDFAQAAELFSAAVQIAQQEYHEEFVYQAIRSLCWQSYAEIRAGGALRVAGRARIRALELSLRDSETLSRPAAWIYHFVLGVEADLASDSDRSRTLFNEVAELSRERTSYITGTERKILANHLAEYASPE